MESKRNWKWSELQGLLKRCNQQCKIQPKASHSWYPSGQYWRQYCSTVSSMTWMMRWPSWWPGKDVDDKKLREVADTSECYIVIWRDLKGLKKWVDRYLIKFNKWSAKSCTWGGINAFSNTHWSQLAEKQIDRKVLESPGGQEVDHGPAICFFSKEVLQCPGMCKVKHWQQVKEVIPPFHPLLVRYIWSTRSCSELKKDMDILGWVHERPWGWFRYRSIWLTRTGWETWDCSA